MDPLSVLSGISAVSQLAYHCSSSLHGFISATKQVDENVHNLYGEVRSLKKTSESLEGVLRNPAVQTFQDGALWLDADESLQACASTLKRFEKTLYGLRASNGSGGSVVENPIRQLKLQLREEGMAKLRAQLHSHSLALHTILATINIHMASTGPTIVLNEIVPRIEVLTKYLMSMERDEHMNDIPASDEHASFIRRTNSQLARTAKLVMSRANTVAEEARSSIYGSATISTVDEVGSLYEYIHGNANPNYVIEQSSYENLTRNPAELGAISEVVTLESYDSDEELDIEMAEQYVKLGDEASQRGDYHQAESFFSKALKRPRLLARISNPVGESELNIKLAQTLLQQEKDIGKARKICELLVQAKMKDDTNRKTVLDATFILAQIHFATGLFADSYDLCRRVIDGRRRLSGKNSEYFQAVALMSQICEVQGDNIDSITYRKLLPEDFYAPVFKRNLVMAERLQPIQVKTAKPQLSTTVRPVRTVTPVKHPEPKIVSADSSAKFEQYLTETNFITLPIPLSEIEDVPDNTNDYAASMISGRDSRRKSLANFFKRMSISGSEEPIRMVRMTRDEYNKYWIRDSSGNYIGTEPEGSGRERLRRGLAGTKPMTLVESRFKGEAVWRAI